MNPPSRGAATLPLRADLRGRLRRRYKRFFADVETPDGELLTVHCPNPGSMRGCAVEGAAVRCSTSDDPKRRLRHTLEMIRRGHTWVGLHTGRANPFTDRLLARGVVPSLAGYAHRRREVPVKGGRLDFRLEGHAGGAPPAWLEVKSVTLAEGSAARFPDSVTERGRRHARTLAALCEAGERAVLLFVVQRADCEWVEPADDIDPAYGEALRDAVDRGVELVAVQVRVTPSALRYQRALPVRL